MYHYSFFFFCLFLSFCPLRAAPAAYGGSQARGLIGAVAASLCQRHSNAGSKPRLRPIPQLMATPDPPTTEPQRELQLLFFFLSFVFCLVVVVAISWATPAAYGGSQARGPVGAVATGLRQSHSNVGSELCLRPTPQLTATPDR